MISKKAKRKAKKKAKQEETDRYWMRVAIAQAHKAAVAGDYAIAAVVVGPDGKGIATAGNNVHLRHDPTGHAEITAIRLACAIKQSRYLKGCTLYSTCAPCAMCLGACVWACMRRVVYGASQRAMFLHGMEYGIYSRKAKNPKFKWRATLIEPDLLYTRYLYIANPGMDIIGDVLQEECEKLFHENK